MKSGGKSLYRQQPKEDDLQRPHSVRNLVIGTGVLGAITLICWYGTGASQSGSSSNGFIACSAANCPAALPGESQAAAQANANGSSSGNPKAIGGSTKRSGTVTGLSPIISALVSPSTTGTGTTVGPVVLPSTSASGTTPTTPATVKPTTVAPTTVKPTTVAPTTVAPTTVAPTTVAPTTVAPTTVAPTTVAPTTVAPTTVPPTTADPVTS
ncbi:MAG TPA: hypothetical protein VFE59_44570 [Trebonia sp.]|nr:hypothetical protein [Trebonia sp.]